MRPNRQRKNNRRRPIQNRHVTGVSESPALASSSQRTVHLTAAVHPLSTSPPQSTHCPPHRRSRTRCPPHRRSRTRCPPHRRSPLAVHLTAAVHPLSTSPLSTSPPQSTRCPPHRRSPPAVHITAAVHPLSTETPRSDARARRLWPLDTPASGRRE